MRKLGKILIIIIVVIGVIVGGVFTFNKIKEVKKNNERVNAKNLMEYIKTHNNPNDFDFCEGEDCYEYTISSPTENGFKCDVLDKNIKDIYGNYLILEDNSIYEMDFYQLYSNNQNCKKVDLDIEIKDIKHNYIISQDNKVYKLSSEENSLVSQDKTLTYILLNDTKIKRVISRETTFIDSMITKQALLKEDGQVYLDTYRGTQLEESKVILSNSEYGKIKSIEMYYNSYNDEMYIDSILSDKGYYYKGKEITEECTKYKDVKCEEKIMESEIYKKFSNDIRIIGDTYTLLTDNSIIRTDSLTKKLDKDLK